MSLNPFAKKKADKKPAPAAPEVSDAAPEVSRPVGAPGSYPALRGLFVSEKASMLGQMGQYVFHVAPGANKSEIAKQVSKLYNVKVKDVKVMNMPRKRRDIGRHPGFRPGWRKAIVVLQAGEVIGAAKP